jgi:TIR domain
MARVFLSHAGEEWEQRLHERLRWADAVVCVITKVAVASTWCTAEVSIALSRGSRLLPVRAEPGVDHPLLRSVQYADFPFPGLRPFDVEDHRVFFGRSDEVEKLAALLRSPAERADATVLVVVGPSGCGKFSLVRAGLLHVMAEDAGAG